MDQQPPELEGPSAPPALRVRMYVDGFNLYHGLKEHSKARQYRWLNLRSLAEGLLLPGHRLDKVLYFTSLPPWNQAKASRHEVYLDALAGEGVEVIRGRFQRDTQVCFADCEQIFPVYVEKLTDVHIATTLLRDAVLDRFDWAYLVTGDADQAPAIRTLAELAPAKRVRVVFPPRRQAAELQQVAAASFGPLGHRDVKRHVFPDVVTVGTRQLRKPDGW